MKSRYLISALAGGALALSSAVQARLIDDFDTGNQLLIVNKGDASYGIPPIPWASGQVSGPSAGTTGILGGYRDLWVGIDAPNTQIPLNAMLAVQAGFLSLSNDSLVDTSTLWKWDGANGAYTGTTGGTNPNPSAGSVGGFAPVDLTDGGTSNEFRFTVLSQDGDTNFVITVYEGASAVSFAGNSGGAFRTPQVLAIPMTAFANGTATLANFDRVTAVTVKTDTGASDRDFTINRLETGGNCSGSIGDVVWVDKNGDGLQGVSEPGIPGVTVQLFNPAGDVAQTALTDGNGFYAFTGLCPGYPLTVKVTGGVPAGFTPTTIGSANGNDLIADDSNDPVGTTVQLLNDGDSNPTQDFGYVPPCDGTIGNFVWVDENRNGLQDATELGIANVTVLLLDAGNAVVQTSVTDGNGAYGFSGICPNIPYQVRVAGDTVPAGFLPTAIGSNDGNDLVAGDSNDPDGTGVMLPTSGGANDNLALDFGYMPPCDGTIGNFVWVDQYRNGLQDTGEPGIANVTVLLVDAGNAVVQTAVTDGNGAYRFSGVCPNTPYQVKVEGSTVPAGFLPTTLGSNNGNDLVADDNNDPNGTGVMLPGSGGANDNPTLDFGYAPPCNGTVGDLVWIDQNGNGLQDANEPGIAGVQVQLFDALNTLLQTAVTDGAGLYAFTGVCPYSPLTVKVKAGVPAGFAPTFIGSADGNDLVSTDSNDPAGTAVQLETAPGVENNPTLDFGYVPPCDGTIGNFVWIDQNGNGRQDAGEPGIAGVKVELFNAANAVVQTAVTDGNGAYGFTGLCTYLAYTVKVTAGVPAGFTPTLIGSNDGNDLVPNDSNDPNGTGVTLPTSGGANANPTLDFGYVPPCDGTIGNFVWVDQNGNGRQDPGEPGIAGVQVQLLDALGVVVRTVVTDVNGTYGFTGICPYTPYTVKVTGGVPALYTPTAIGSNNGNDLVANDSNDQSGTRVELPTVQGNMANPMLDFGYVAPDAGGGTQGCTPGYWKQQQHFFAWTAPYSPNLPGATKFSDVFENAFPGQTLLQVLGLNGGGLNALGRHTVAALLNAASSGVDSPYSVQEVVDAFNAAYPGSNYEPLKNEFDAANNLGCPLANGK